MRSHSQILIVDHQPATLDALVNMLAPAGYKLLVAADARSALKRIAQHDPDLVLLALTLPDRDGVTLCRQIRAAADGAGDVPILMLMPQTERDALGAALAAGADGCICQPYLAADVRARVAAILQRDLYRRLRAARDDLTAVLAYATQPFLVLDDAGAIRRANPAAGHLLGFDPAQLPATAPGPNFLTLARERFSIEPYLNWRRWPGFAAAPDRRRYLIARDAAQTPYRVDVVRRLAASDGRGWLIAIDDDSANVQRQQIARQLNALVVQPGRAPLAGLALLLDQLAQEAGTLSADARARLLTDARTRVTQLRDQLERAAHLLADPTAQVGGDVAIAQLAAAVRAAAAEFGLSLRERAGRPLPAGYLAPPLPRLRLILHALIAALEAARTDRPPLLNLEIAAPDAGEIQLTLTASNVWLDGARLATLLNRPRFAQGDAPALTPAEQSLQLATDLLAESGGRLTVNAPADDARAVVRLFIPRRPTPAD